MIREETLGERLYRGGLENADLDDRFRFLVGSRLLPGSCCQRSGCSNARSPRSQASLRRRRSPRRHLRSPELRVPGAVVQPSRTEATLHTRTIFLFLSWGLALATLLADTVLTLHNVRTLVEDERWVAHTHEVKEQLSGVLASIVDVETSVRGYVISQDVKYLEPAKRAKATYTKRMVKLDELLRDNPEQAANLAKLQRMNEEHQALVDQKIAAVQRGATEEALAIVRTGRGKSDDGQDPDRCSGHGQSGRCAAPRSGPERQREVRHYRIGRGPRRRPQPRDDDRGLRHRLAGAAAAAHRRARGQGPGGDGPAQRGTIPPADRIGADH